MKKSTLAVIAVIVLVIIGIAVFGRSGSSPTADTTNTPATGSTASSSEPYVPSTETTSVSSKTKEYQNSELGFSVKYPAAWEKVETDSGVSFIMPIDTKQVSTVATLKGDISVSAGKCAFPPVTTIKDRGTVAIAGVQANMISMQNDVQGRSYFNRMYEIQKGSICYVFAFSSITQSLSAKNLTGSNATQAQNNNKAIVASSDTDFTNVVKSFAFVVGPQGTDETQASPAK